MNILLLLLCVVVPDLQLMIVFAVSPVLAIFALWCPWFMPRDTATEFRFQYWGFPFGLCHRTVAPCCGIWTSPSTCTRWAEKANPPSSTRSPSLPTDTGCVLPRDLPSRSGLVTFDHELIKFDVASSWLRDETSNLFKIFFFFFFFFFQEAMNNEQEFLSVICAVQEA